ncbi:MAG: hypothetical protein RH860_00140 [Cytophagales bacterium]
MKATPTYDYIPAGQLFGGDEEQPVQVGQVKTMADLVHIPNGTLH